VLQYHARSLKALKTFTTYKSASSVEMVSHCWWRERGAQNFCNKSRNWRQGGK